MRFSAIPRALRGRLLPVVVHGMLVSFLWGTGAPAPLSGQTLLVRPELDAPLTSRTGVPRLPRVRRPRVGLVLSGGGARGVAQIGVLKVLERHKIPVDFIAATSIGAIVGGLYAAGYTTTELESIVVATNWDEILSLSDRAKRTDLFVDQKQALDRGFIAFRFEGLEPVLPSAVSTGQRLTDFLSLLTLQALYHPAPDFDALRIPFRAVATDLVSGRLNILRDGSLAEALRASATVPLLFTPIEKEGMQLVDGGLLSNIPVDVARAAGCDIIIVVNSTSGLRNADEMKAPWQTADQIMGIMMGPQIERQLRGADVVITPAIGRHLSSDFSGLDSLIRRGEESAAAHVAEILRAVEGKKLAMAEHTPGGPPMEFANPRFERAGPGIADSLWDHIRGDVHNGNVWLQDVQDHVNIVAGSGDFRSVHAEVARDSSGSVIRYVTVQNPEVRRVAFDGCWVMPAGDLESSVRGLIGNPWNPGTAAHALEEALRVYRNKGYSLARIDSSSFDPTSGTLRAAVNEGLITGIDVLGGVRTRDSFILSEFPLARGDVFEVAKARKGIANITSSALFEYVYLEVETGGDETRLTIRLRERPSQLVRLGVRADDERFLQGSIDIRDINFRGAGTELGLTLAGGQRNADALVEFKAPRLFNTYLTFQLHGFFRTRDSYVYTDGPPAEANRWTRVRFGEYRDIRYGAGVAFGTQLERLGTATVELLMQNVRLKNLENVGSLEERHSLAMVRLGSVVDTKDSYPFPAKGVGLNLSYEFALESLGSDVGYNALSCMYESYTSWGRFTFHPRFTVGFADRTMPLVQQFRLGGRETLVGVKEDDRRGRQLLLLNLEYRYHLPFQVLFDAYVRARYDLGSIAAVPEEIKFSALRHGIGVELALDTPVGPATVGLGKSFYFSKDLPSNPIQEGPFLVTFMIGYQW